MLRKRLTTALLLLLAWIVLAVTGVPAVKGSSATFQQALYMAVITLTDVGYGDIVDTSAARLLLSPAELSSARCSFP